MTIPTQISYTHGSTGSAPATPLDYQNGDALDADNLDFYVNEPVTKINSIIDALNAIDSDNDEVVDQADLADEATSALSYKGKDIDTDGDGKVNEAEQADYALNADAVDGLEPPFSSSVSNDGAEIVAVPTDINFGDGISVSDDGDDTVTVTGPASVSEVSGPDSDTHHAGSLPQFSGTSNGLSATSEGDLFYNTDDNSVYLNDGT